MGRPRSVFLDVELPADRVARRKILKNLYNKRRNLSLNYLKVFSPLTPSLRGIVEW